MPSPINKKQIQSFIGMIYYLSKFSPRLSELAEPLRELSKHKVPFNKGPEHQQPFTQMKKEIPSAPVLTYYHPKKQTTLQTDASVKGLGACLLQYDRPVYFASKALTHSQIGYVAIELESFAMAWAMEEFHHFLHASHFILETDQKLPEAILSMSLNQATPGLQQILIWKFPYHFTVKYIPGNTNQLAYCLSWLGGEKDTIKLPKLYIHQITSQPNNRSGQLEWYKNCYPRRWWACTTQAYHNAWMTKYHQTSTKWNITILGLLRRADHLRWYCLEGHPDRGTTQEMSSYISTHT